MSKAARPPLSELGLTTALQTVIWGEVLLLACCAVLYPLLGLRFVWSSAQAAIPIALAPWILWLYFVWQPGRSRKDWVIAERFLLLGILFSVFLIHPQAQYVAFAFQRPLVGAHLAAADRWLGLEVTDSIRWTLAHPAWRTVFTWCYQTLLFQFWLPLVALWASPQDRADLREYVGLFYATSLVTLVCVAVWPAEPPPAVYHGLAPLLNEARVMQQINDVRSGALTAIDLQNLDGIISLPSFHVIGALVVTWSMRHKPVVREVLLLINAGLIAATFMLGIHFFVDLLAGVAIAATAIGLSSAFSQRRAHGI